MKIYQHIASRVAAIENCRNAGNVEWETKHSEVIRAIAREYLPSGGGVDSGARFRFGGSSAQKLILETSFHHMDEGGGYDGWTDHTVTVRPCLRSGIVLSISGRNENGIKEYLHDLFWTALNREIPNDDPVIVRATEGAR